MCEKKNNFVECVKWSLQQLTKPFMRRYMEAYKQLGEAQMTCEKLEVCEVINDSP